VAEVAERARILVLDTSAAEPATDSLPSLADSDLVRTTSLTRGLELLRSEHFDGFYADTHDAGVLQRAANLLQAERILRTVPDGVAVVNPDLCIIWANTAFEAWCDGAAVGRAFYEALGSPEILGPDYSPFHAALTGRATRTQLKFQGGRYLDLFITPIHEPGGPITKLIGVARDVTAQVNQEQKLQALHQAGNELAPLAPEQLAEMSAEERIELLKLNIRRLTHDLFKYHVIEIRLLDRATGRLELLLQDGMSESAVHRVLYARPEGNGVTGYVAATGKSYLCLDTSVDPLYLEGASGARSSLTVPIIGPEGVVGTFNVESTQPNAFAENDRQFLEIFCREIALALHTLELLSAEKQSTASKSVDAVSREVALPVDDILTATTALLDRYIGHEPEMADRLRHILTAARAIKQCIQRVGEDLGTGPLARPGEPSVHSRLKGLRILVADNDERVRRSAHGILGRFGCIVETARDGKEALTMAKLGTYDVVLADIRLPDLGGYEMFHRLRQAQPKARVVLMTAYGYDPSHAIVKARQEGLDSVLYKPFRIDQLLSVLEKPEPPVPVVPPASSPAPTPA
jgi:CheY-like chemotaxis protein/PAS domain-containing protein